jgi:LEA14-like dessication related protein
VTALLLWISLLAAAPVAASPALALTVEPGSGDSFTAIVEGPAESGAPGDFRGTVALYGSPVSLPVSGRAARTRDGRLAISVSIRYAAVPPDWSTRFRPLSVDVALDGSAGGRPVTWRGRLLWEDIAWSADSAMAGRFLSLAEIRLTDVSLSTSEGVADLSVRNPFSFPLTIASSEYRVEAAGREIGRGATRGVLVRPSRRSVVQLPVEVENGQLAAAAGRTLLSAGDVEARLRGWIKLRLGGGGEVRIPLDLGGRLRSDS